MTSIDSEKKMETDIDIKEYTEPNYEYLTKREYFDEDNAKYLLSDESFNKEDRKHLSMYNRHRISGSYVNCSYKFGAGCEELKIGRLYPVDGIGLQSFRFDIRNPLTKKYYWDIDFENAHYYIAEKYCKEYGIKHEKITYYITHREECLSSISTNRKKAKTEFLRVLYGGDIKLYNDTFHEIDGSINIDAFEFMKDLEKEIETLSVLIWERHSQYHKLKTGKDRVAIMKKHNPKFSLMSLIFQNEERKLLMILDWYLTKRDRYMGVFIHDGGLVEKLEGETEFPKSLLREAENIINDISGYRMKLTVKEINYEWKPYKPQLTQYEIMKQEFEKNNFLVGSIMYCIHSDGYEQSMRISDAKVKFSNKHVNIWDDETQKIKRKKFLDLWLDDEKRLQYERVDFCPNRTKCPPTIYNLFKGFNVEKYKPEIELEWDVILDYVKPINEHIDYLTSGYSERVNKWFANIIQDPDMKSDITMIIRDTGKLLTEGGGIGKNLLFEWFGNEILGEKYFVIIGNNSDLYSSFNSIFESKLLTLIEEASGKTNHSNVDVLQSKITAKKTIINKKNLPQYNVSDYNRFIFCSNNENPLPIRKGARRYDVYDSNPVKRGDIEYFKKLAKHLENPDVKWAYYKYLSSLKTYKSPIEFQSTIPITKAYRDIRYINAPLYHKWLVHCVITNTLKDNYTSDLYKEFTQWIQENRERSPENLITQAAFGKILMGSDEIRSDIDGTLYKDYEIDNMGDKVKSHGVMYMSWNIEAVINSLKKIYLLDDNFKI